MTHVACSQPHIPRVQELVFQQQLDALAFGVVAERDEASPGETNSWSELCAPGVVVVSLVEGSDKRSCIAQDHADAAPLASSLSG
jgi:hypothetical protein